MALPVYSDVEVKGKVVVDDKVTVGNSIFTKDNSNEPIFNYAEKSIKLDKIIGKEIEITDGNTKITNNGIETIRAIVVKADVGDQYSLIYKTGGFRNPIEIAGTNYSDSVAVGIPLQFKLSYTEQITQDKQQKVTFLKYTTLIERGNSVGLQLVYDENIVTFSAPGGGYIGYFDNIDGGKYDMNMYYTLFNKEYYQVVYTIRAIGTVYDELTSHYLYSSNMNLYIEPTAIAYVYNVDGVSEYRQDGLTTDTVDARQLVSVADTVVIDNGGIKIKNNNIVEYNSEENRTILQNIYTANIDTIKVNDIQILFGKEQTKPLCYGTKFISFTADNDIISSTNITAQDPQFGIEKEFYMGGVKNIFRANLDLTSVSGSSYKIANSSISNMYFTISFNNDLEGDNIYLINLNIADPKNIVELELKGNYNYNFELFLDIKFLIERLIESRIENITTISKHKAKITVTSSFGTLSPSESVVFLEEYCTDFSGQQLSSYKKHHLTPSNNKKEIGLPVQNAAIETLYISRPYI